jgi:6-pyruvoyl-tetrahydropterin synthase
MTKLFVNNLTIIDSSLLDLERGLVGESWRVDVELEGSLNRQGMVLDFADIKRQVKQVIDQYFDHKLLIPAANPSCQISEHGGETEIECQLGSGAWIRHNSPATAVTQIVAERVDTETLTTAIMEKLQPGLPDNVEDFLVRLHHESTSDPSFHYSHGLKQHAGNCQRIAHGHRSRIEIYQDEKRNRELESEWAELWRDIYIGNSSDLAERFTSGNEEYYRFAYRAEHGEFRLELPKRLCYLIDTDSTVENLAQHIADSLKQQHPESAFQVRVFEGVDKGAVGES